jgi:hypothetical protein
VAAHVLIGRLLSNDVSTIAPDHDLVVVASGRGSLIDMFPRIPEYSPYDRPQRLLSSAFYDGFTEIDPNGMSFIVAPVTVSFSTAASTIPTAPSARTSCLKVFPVAVSNLS